MHVDANPEEESLIIYDLIIYDLPFILLMAAFK